MPEVALVVVVLVLGVVAVAGRLRRMPGARRGLLALVAILLLFLALGIVERPILGGDREVLVLCVDISRGMGPQPDLIVGDAIARLDVDGVDHVIVVAVGATPLLVHEGPPHALPAAPRLPASFATPAARRRTDLAAALELISGRLEDGDRTRLVVVTDGGFVLEDTLSHGSAGFASVTVEESRTDSGDDAAIRFVTPPLLLAPGVGGRVEAEVFGRVREPREVAVFVGGIEVRRVILTPDRPAARVELPVAPDTDAVRAVLSPGRPWDVDRDNDIAVLPIARSSDRPRVVLVAEVGGDAIEAALNGRVVVTRCDAAAAIIRLESGGADIAIIHDVPAERLGGLDEALGRFARAGGGVLLAGARMGFGLGRWQGTALDALSPLASEPGRRPLQLRVGLDRSGSMARGRRFDAARAAVEAVYAELGDDDELLLTAFAGSSTTTRWTVDDGVAALRQHLDGLTATGPTRLALAMEELLAPVLEDGPDTVIFLVTDGEDPTALTDQAVAEWNARARAAAIVVHVFWFDRDEGLRSLLQGLVTETGGGIVPIDDFADLRSRFLERARGRLVIEEARVANASGAVSTVGRLVRTRTREGADVSRRHDRETAVVATIPHGAGRVAAAAVSLDVDGAALFDSTGGLADFVSGLAGAADHGATIRLLEEPGGGWRYRIDGWEPAAEVATAELVGPTGVLHLNRVGVDGFRSELIGTPPPAGLVAVRLGAGPVSIRQAAPGADLLDRSPASGSQRVRLLDRLEAQITPPGSGGSPFATVLLVLLLILIDVGLVIARR